MPCVEACCAVLCCAVPCRAVLCPVVPCCAMLCFRSACLMMSWSTAQQEGPAAAEVEQEASRGSSAHQWMASQELARSDKTHPGFVSVGLLVWAFHLTAWAFHPHRIAGNISPTKLHNAAGVGVTDSKPQHAPTAGCSLVTA